MFSCKLYESDGSTLVYDFEKVLDWGDGPLLDPYSFTQHTSYRGQGSIVSQGSKRSWELPIQVYLSASDYDSIFALLENLRDTIVFNTKYILKIGKDVGTIDLKVKRLTPIPMPITNDRSKVVRSERPVVTFTVDCWS